MNSIIPTLITTRLIPLLRILCIRGLILGILFSFANQTTFAQNFSKAFLKCYETDQARFQCYATRFSNLLERAKERAELRQSILEAQASKRLELQVPLSARREIDREEIRKLVEASLKRNVSHQGEKYSLTYGFVLEPRD